MRDTKRRELQTENEAQPKYASKVPFCCIDKTSYYSRNSKEKLQPVLIDSEKNRWFFKEGKDRKYTLVIDKYQSGYIQKVVYGTPNIYEFEDFVIVICEGDGEQGTVYQFCKHTIGCLNEWKLNGYLWNVNIYNGEIIVTAYLVEEDLAGIYRLKNDWIRFIELGEHFSPTDILIRNEGIFVSGCPIFDQEVRKLYQLNGDFEIIDVLNLKLSPRYIMNFQDEIVIQELNLQTGKSDRLSYINLKTKNETVYQISNYEVVRNEKDSLLLLDTKNEVIAKWDHESKSISNIKYLKTNQKQKIS